MSLTIITKKSTFNVGKVSNPILVYLTRKGCLSYVNVTKFSKYYL